MKTIGNKYDQQRDASVRREMKIEHQTALRIEATIFLKNSLILRWMRAQIRELLVIRKISIRLPNHGKQNRNRRDDENLRRTEQGNTNDEIRVCVRFWHSLLRQMIRVYLRDMRLQFLLSPISGFTDIVDKGKR
ncbi:MAG TPA: hypothetical protein VFT65_11155 [Candidatus Angelobacter sp.]|nr:hypothetical protein [Candidatus Angelobacter sp.]